jgi:proteasome beta subunit
VSRPFDPQPLMLRHAAAHGSSFHDFLSATAPELLPRNASVADLAPHATTIVAAGYAEGVVLAGDRRATMGNLIAQRDIEKVFAADSRSIVGIAGTAGIAVQIVRLFQVELEHYEKIEGTSLTLDGKANRLGTMIRGNLGAAMQGLAAVPLFAGYDEAVDDPAQAGKIYGFDAVGGIYRSQYYDAIGSGSVFAKSSLKKLWSPGLDRAAVVRTVIEALYDAADDDSATGGPDLQRSIFPRIMVATGDGVSPVSDEEQQEIVRAVVADRTQRPGT